MFNIFFYEIVDGEAKVTGYAGSKSVITIPSTVNEYNVTSIGAKAFYDNRTIKSVTISDGIKSIGKNAFYSCGITEVSIPSSVTVIENRAFAGCTVLPEITIPDSVESIGEQAFTGCYKLEKVTIGDGVKSLGNEAF